MKRVVFITLICVFAVLPARAALYETVDLKCTSVNPAVTMTINSSGYNGGTLSGIYNLSLKNATNTLNGFLGDGTDSLFAVEAFCIDVWDYSPGSFVNYDIIPLDEAPDPGAGPMGTIKASHLAELFNNYWNGPLDNITASAIQIATWEVVDEETTDAASYSVSSGSFWVSGNSSVINLANTMLGSISTNGAAFNNYVALSNNTTEGRMGLYQDYVVNTPIPASVILGLLGIGIVGLKLRKYA